MLDGTERPNSKTPPPPTASHPVHLIFDFDNTITTKDTISELFFHAENYRPASEEARRAGLPGIRPSNPSEQQLLRAQTEQLISKYKEDAARNSLQRPTFEPGMFDTMKRMIREDKEIEERSLTRVSESGIFAGLGDDFWFRAGVSKRAEGRVVVRKGFEALMQKAAANNWKTTIISANWSQWFIMGVLQMGVTVYANNISMDGVIQSPRGWAERITTCKDKKAILDSISLPSDQTLYFGDSLTDLECLERGGFILAEDENAELIKSFRDLGYPCPHIGEARTQGMPVPPLVWMRDFEEFEEGHAWPPGVL